MKSRGARSGFGLLETLLYVVIAVVALNLICVTYNKSVSVLRFISGRSDDLQGLDLVLRNLKRDTIGASDVDAAGNSATFTTPQGEKTVYRFSDGQLTRNGVTCYPGFATFTVTHRRPDLVQIDIRLNRRGKKTGRLVSTVVCMRNIRETAR